MSGVKSGVGLRGDGVYIAHHHCDKSNYEHRNSRAEVSVPAARADYADGWGIDSIHKGNPEQELANNSRHTALSVENLCRSDSHYRHDNRNCKHTHVSVSGPLEVFVP